MATFKEELEHVINRHSRESDSNTPDFILATFMAECLDAWNHACRERQGADEALSIAGKVVRGWHESNAAFFGDGNGDALTDIVARAIRQAMTTGQERANRIVQERIEQLTYQLQCVPPDCTMVYDGIKRSLAEAERIADAIAKGGDRE